MMSVTSEAYDQIEEAVARLVSTRKLGDSAMVSLPIAYPSGAHAAVSISVAGEDCFVSDCALGLREAEMAGAFDFFDAAAKKASEWFGVGYDGASVFAVSTHLDRIGGAITSVANASVAAASRAIVKAVETKDRGRNSEVFEIISDIFGRQNVERKVEISGRDASWEAHNVVSIRGMISIFEYVSAHQNSIASKYLMFSDLVKAAAPPKLISVVPSLEQIGPKGSMLGDVSDVIPLQAEREVFRRYARAA